MILWIGASVSPQLLKDLLDVDDIIQVDPQLVRFEFSAPHTVMYSTRFRSSISLICPHGCPPKSAIS